jgi:hypothetical protein
MFKRTHKRPKDADLAAAVERVKAGETVVLHFPNGATITASPYDPGKVHPDTIRITGDMSEADIEAKVREAFGKLKETD